MKQVPESFLKDVAFHIGMMLELPVEEPDFTDD
jgi:hypothetical protein